jgi:rhodanese-related sulfurtransferase/tRNA A-37 threonylcarbamoyl transferase component Bud32
VSRALESLNAVIADRYAIEREAGRGGMATVYEARDVKHGRRVAIKVLEPELAAVLGAERFLREIEIVARLSHPHILALYDSGEANGQLYYVMPFVEGDTLRSRLDRERQLAVEDAVRIVAEVAAALDYAHRCGVVHRDVKPENILLQDGHALVADFGIALAVSRAGGDRLTGTGLSLGTPFYMSPEQAVGDRAIDARSDVYSLGCVLYETLAGEPPFTGPTPQAVVARILTEQPRELRAVRPNVSPALQQVVMRALARLPADRYASVAAFAEALQRATSAHWPDEHRAASAWSGAPAERTADPRARRAVAVAARVAPWGLALAASAAAVWLWLGGAPAATDASASPALAEGELSTEAMQRIVAESGALVLDTRPHLEYSISHLPGAQNVAARPGVPMSVYISDVAQVARLVRGDTLRPIVLYCNGPYCPKSRRTATELALAGHRSVRRYQLGIPVWRALGGVTETEADGLRYIAEGDRTAVLIDAREPEAFRAGSIPGARNLPRSGVAAERDAGELRKAKDDGRLPMHDHNTRIVVIGQTPEQARYVAQALAHEAFHNVSYFAGTFDEAWAALRAKDAAAP